MLFVGVQMAKGTCRTCHSDECKRPDPMSYKVKKNKKQNLRGVGVGVGGGGVIYIQYIVLTKVKSKERTDHLLNPQPSTATLQS